MLALLIALLAWPVRAQDLALDVNAAIDRGVARLRQVQADDGAFASFGNSGGDPGRYPMGYAALPLYTLLEAGVRPDDPVVTRSLARLAGLPFRQVYSTAVYVLALDALGSALDEAGEARLLEAAAWLEGHFLPGAGQWAYPDGEPELSNTQYAVMALRAAQEHGYEVPSTLWLRLVDGALSQQVPGGGFRYRANHHQLASGSMTTAGLAVLQTCVEQLSGDGRSERKARAAAEEGLAAGWAWMERHVTVTGNPYGESGLLRDRAPRTGVFTFCHDYYLYGLQRACVLGDRRRLAGLDWYRAGARELLSRELPGGGWHDLESTCFALLFLRRATVSGVGASQDFGEDVDAAAASSAGASARASATATASAGASAGGAAAAGGRTSWRYRTRPPGKGWEKARYDDERWDVGSTPIHTGATSGWTDSEIWLRRRFRWPLPDGAPLELWCLHDDGVTLWLDGEQVAHDPLYSRGAHKRYPLDDRLLAGLEPGEHLLAAHVVNTGGPGVFDLAFSDPARQRRGPPGSGASWQAEPSPDAALLRRWLVLSPVKGGAGRHLADPVLPAVEPRAGARELGAQWKPYRGLSGVLPLSGGRDASVGLAACWLHVEQRTRAVLWFGAEDGVRAWLDDVPIVSDHLHRALRADELPAVVDIMPGGQRLLVASEILGGDGRLCVRLSDALGAPLRGVALSLDPAAPEPAAAALAQPELVGPAVLLEQLPASSERSMGFGRADDLEAVSIGPVGAHGVAHVARSEPESGLAAPPPGGRGMLQLRAASRAHPLTLSWRVTGPGRGGRLEARVAADVGSTPGSGGARVRLGVFDDSGPRWLAEQLVADRGGKPSSRDWVELSAELPADVQWPALVRVQVEADPGCPGSPCVFLDELSLR